MNEHWNYITLALLSYQLAHPDDKNEIVEAAKVLDKVREWDEAAK